MMSTYSTEARPYHEWFAALPVASNNVVCGHCRATVHATKIDDAPTCTHLERIPDTWLSRAERDALAVVR